MKKIIALFFVTVLFLSSAPVFADSEDDKKTIDGDSYTFQIPAEWTDEAPFYYKDSRHVSKLSVLNLEEFVSFEELLASGDAYKDNYLSDVESSETIIAMHETSYSEYPALTLSVFGQVDGNPVVVQNDIFQNPSGSLVSFTYYYDDDNRDYIAALDSLRFNNADDSASDTLEDHEPTMGEKNALSSAELYLDYTPFSYTGLIEQLEFEGYSTEEATYAADNCGADWNEQAALSAELYLDYTSFSRTGLIDQLMFEGFSQEQAEYAASAVGY